MLTYILIFISTLIVRSEQLDQYNYAQIYDNISQEIISQHLDTLASDMFMGRGTGSEGEILASEYIAGELKEYGIKPGNGTDYFQNVPMHGLIPLEESELKIHNGEKSYSFDLYDDYVIYRSGSTTFIPKPIDIVFVGYGISAPEFGYDDYKDLDVAGKIVAFIGGEPYSEDNNYFNGELPTVYSSPEAKQRIALGKGAFGSIYIPIPDELYEGYWEDVVNELKFEYVTLAYSVSDHFSISFKHNNFSILFANAKYNLDDIYEMYLLNNMQSFDLKAKLEFRGKYKTRDFKGRNVVGIIEGNDRELKNEYIILSAHYDHLGIGPVINGDSIYNGLMDNAIGCAALLEIARLYKEEDISSSRSIIFLFVTGEEKGLLGSTYYTDFPIKPISNTIANINIDGVAFIDEFKSIISIGGKFSSLDRIIKETAIEFELVLEEFSEAITETESFNRSDQVAFANAGIPACMILDGTYYKNIDESEGIDILYDYFVNRYHKPFDDKSQHINYNAVKQHIAFLTKFSMNVANSYTSPQWNEDSIFGQR